MTFRSYLWLAFFIFIGVLLGAVLGTHSSRYACVHWVADTDMVPIFTGSTFTIIPMPGWTCDQWVEKGGAK